jgi:hypothetical protein
MDDKTTLRRDPIMNTRIFALCCCVAGILATSYLGWALKRSSGSTMIAEGRKWPRAWPYPDQWLLRWHEKLDATYPAPDRGIKLHGEWPRLHLYLLGFVSASLMLTVSGAAWMLFCDGIEVKRPERLKTA